MMYLTDIHDPGLTILPTHRVLRGLSPAFVQQLPVCLRDTCDLEAFPCRTPAEQEAQRQRLIDEMRRCGPARIRSLYGRRDVLADLSRLMATQTPTAGCNAASVLDVSLLHDLLLEKVLRSTFGRTPSPSRKTMRRPWTSWRARSIKWRSC